MKMGVGIMLTSFGVFWVGEGAGIHWPGSDLAILVLIALYLAVAGLGSAWLRRSAGPVAAAAGAPPARAAAEGGQR